MIWLRLGYCSNVACPAIDSEGDSLEALLQEIRDAAHCHVEAGAE